MKEGRKEQCGEKNMDTYLYAFSRGCEIFLVVTQHIPAYITSTIYMWGEDAEAVLKQQLHVFATSVAMSSKMHLSDYLITVGVQLMDFMFLGFLSILCFLLPFYPSLKKNPSLNKQ